MFEVRELLNGCSYKVICGSDSAPVSDAVCDTRKTEEGCLFICIKGSGFDAHDAVEFYPFADVARLVLDDDGGRYIIRTDVAFDCLYGVAKPSPAEGFGELSENAR